MKKVKVIKMNRGKKCGCLCISHEEMKGKTFEEIKKAA